jgi:hypothetical protein
MTMHSHQGELVRHDDEEADRTLVGQRMAIGGEPEPVTSTLDDDLPDEELQRKRYGGVNWGAGFFGSLVVVAVAGLLTVAVAALVAGLERTGDVLPAEAAGEPMTVGLVAAAILLGVLAAAFYAGGYVAGRMSRFDGGRQGAAVWFFGLLLTGSVVGLWLVLGGRYRPQDQVSLPALELSPELTGVAVLGGAALLLVGSLLAAVLGGKVGCRYHRKVDDAAYP